MKCSRSELLLAGLFSAFPIVSFAQTEPLVFEAEAGTLGANLTTGVNGATTYVTTTVNTTTPPAAPHIATHTITFPASGNWELYARVLVGPASANDDSFYFGQGFGVKTPELAADWALQNEATTGFANPAATVIVGGTTGSNVFKWIKLTGSPAGGPNPWVVPAGELTQTFQWGTREDGLQLDKFAFGRPGVCYTVANLDNGQAASGTCPPPPPPEPPPYTRTDPAIATGKDKYLGGAWSPGNASLEFANYWNQVTPENGGKWGTVEGTRDVMNWAQADAAYALAKANGYPFKWHTLIWGNQQPAWIESLSTAEQREEIEEWYAAIAERYPDIDQIEVVNEPLHDPPRGATNGNYIEALGGNGTTGWDWVITSFQLARQYFPKPIYITELDIDGVLAGVLNHEVQLAAYQRIFPVFWEHPAVKGVTIWGYVQNNHWRNQQGAWLKYLNGGERPALQWLIRYVQNIPAVVNPQILAVDETAAGGTVLGPVVAVDPDAGTTFSQWQINSDASGKFVIDPATGVVSLAPEAALDFETFTSHVITVSVWDGYNRSAAGTVTIQVGNANDNAPVVTAGQRFNIDDGSRYNLGLLSATDADDGNQPGFTTFAGWQVVGGTGASVFTIESGTGLLQIKRPLLIDFRRSNYTVLATVSDGANTSEPREILVAIPRKVTMCLLNLLQLDVPKEAATLLLRSGAALGSCKRKYPW
ncbi:MAG: xynB 3 [Steroidobacteraceae bacterium]|nr:xynB 3 [Steroidobacteraceae bacterium]